MLTRGMVQGTLQIKRSDAKVREVEFSGRANFLPGRHLWTCRDVTEKRLLEQELHQAQKMEAIGRLAGGVAHDFNNMLTVIRGYADLLLRKLPEEDPNRRYATGILQAADRSAMTTQQLLAFSKRRAPQGCCLNLNEVVSEMGKLIQRLIGEDVQLQFDLATGLKPVWGDPGQMGQVVLNLAINSRDAMPRGGVLKIRTSDLKIPDLEALKGKLKAGNYIRLDVSDTGMGMTEEVKQRIFEPFFTTKETGKGTGLGLSTVYAIVNSSGGYIDVASELGKGTHFTICFPAAELGQRPVC
jgi:two-component system, cell cycle sensor histidine kinase and response regulator CckA